MVLLLSPFLAADNMGVVLALPRLPGVDGLDTDVLSAAILRTLDEHPALRVAFMEGGSAQRVVPVGALREPFASAADAQVHPRAAMPQLLAKPFALDSEVRTNELPSLHRSKPGAVQSDVQLSRYH